MRGGEQQQRRACAQLLLERLICLGSPAIIGEFHSQRETGHVILPFVLSNFRQRGGGLIVPVKNEKRAAFATARCWRRAGQASYSRTATPIARRTSIAATITNAAAVPTGGWSDMAPSYLITSNYI
jgi:hypothetical protein